MNEKYEILGMWLELPPPLIDCMMGRIEIGNLAMESPAEWYVFPPALLPIWSAGTSYYGVWNHWFNEGPRNYVHMGVESWKAYEIGRTPIQFLSHLVLNKLEIDEEILPELRGFCENVGISNIDEIYDFFATGGPDGSGIRQLPQFLTEYPLERIKIEERSIDEYDGRFPVEDFGRQEWWNDSCSCEVSDELMAAWPEGLPVPKWLQEGNKAPVFSEFLGEGKLKEAWLTLNSTGWRFREAQEAIVQLAEVANDPGFSLLTDAWLAAPDSDPGGY